MKYQDLIYFGYEHEDNSRQYQTEFIRDIKERFPNVMFKNAFDSIKGYRQEVYLDAEDTDNYYAWIIANGWLEFSLTGQLMLMDKDKKEELMRYIELAKKEYPNNFKKETE
jgi:hypothetical protein